MLLSVCPVNSSWDEVEPRVVRRHYDFPPHMGNTLVPNGKTVLDIATDIAAIIFNERLSGLCSLYDALGITVEHTLYDFCMESDADCIKAAERSISEIEKTARPSLTSARQELEDQNTTLKGKLYDGDPSDWYSTPRGYYGGSLRLTEEPPIFLTQVPIPNLHYFTKHYLLPVYEQYKALFQPLLT